MDKNIKLILHDLKDENIQGLTTTDDGDTVIFSAFPKVKPCTACYGCWIKTPGMCVINDRAQDFMRFMVKANELCIVSKSLYGGLSTEVKAVMDRSLGYILPFFDLVKNEMHHPPRYDNDIIMNYHIYAADGISISPSEMETMMGIAKANARNFSAIDYTCAFYQNLNELSEVFK